MSVSDPIADMLTRIRNAITAGHDQVTMPASRVRAAIAKLLKDEGFIEDYQTFAEGGKKNLRLRLRYLGRREPAITGLQRVSKPGLRVYVRAGEIPRVYGGLGIAILSTPEGIIAGKEAWHRRVGGELLCYVW